MNNKKLQSALIIVGIVFLVSLTVLINVFISNEVEKGDFIGLDSQYLRTITVTGEGKVYVVPDTASISFAIVTQDKTTETALSQNNEKADKVINYLKEQGIASEDIQTTGFNVYPVYKRDPDFMSREIDYYEVTNRIAVELKDLEKANTVIDGAIRAGANRVDSLQFLVSNEDELKKEAREKAVEQAQEKAQEITLALGVKLGRIMGFSETRDYYLPLRAEKEMMAADLDTAYEVPLEPGENEIIVNVTINYEIR
ncbi:MAG: SIMPL domain-containing protein [Candidatus Pacebacteria bacterium]|nr:SIMPL domain-containing protein [Candidatus Paceibacterota bacterium]